jgi:hypothetical protein
MSVAFVHAYTNPWTHPRGRTVRLPPPRVALVASCETDVINGGETCVCVGACTRSASRQRSGNASGSRSIASSGATDVVTASSCRSRSNSPPRVSRIQREHAALDEQQRHRRHDCLRRDPAALTRCLGAGVTSVGTAGRAPATSRCEGQAGVASYCPAPSIPRCCVSSPCRPALPCRPIFPCAFPYGRAAAHADDHRMRPVDRARDVRVLVAQ